MNDQDAPSPSGTDPRGFAGPPPLDLRVARIRRAREHPNADRLLVLEIDLGDEERQIVAGIRAHYELDELEGRHIVVVANLAPAELRGEQSQGMLLAAENEDGELGLLLAPGAAPGTRIVPDADVPEAGPEKITIKDFGEHVLRAGEDEVTMDGHPLKGAELRVDRGVAGRLR